MKTGARGGNYRVLTDDEVERIYRAALALLDNPGHLCEPASVLDIFHKAGARVDRESRVVRLVPEMIEAAIRSAPSSFMLYGRNDPDMDLLLKPGWVYFGMGGASEPLFLDSRQWRPRDPTKADMVLSTRVGHALPHMDFVQALCMSGDVPKGQSYFHDFDAIFRNTTKPTVINVLERPFTRHLIEMAAAASGGESNLREKPSVMGIVTPFSPLTFSAVSEGMIDAVEAGIPILYSPSPMMAANAPATVAGTVALSAAETLFGLVLAQLIKPGAPVMLKMDTDVFDMRTTQCTYGSPEQNLGKMAVVQLARRWNLPIYGLGGGVEAKVPDGEAAAGAMMSLLMCALAGMTMCQSLGTLSWGQYGSPEMAVLCDEMVHMIKRVLAGITVNDETLALDVIRDVGHGGSFLEHEHTLRFYKQELFFPNVFRRQTIEQWQARGAKMVHDVARERVKEILATAGPVPLPPGVDQELDRALTQAIAWAS